MLPLGSISGPIMKLNKTTTYALRVLLHLAKNPDKMISVNELHQTLNISYKYLGRLMPRLAEDGIVAAQRGKNGGYCLARPQSSINLYQIVDLVEDGMQYQRCFLGFEECSADAPCPIHCHWAPIKEKMLEMCKTLTLDQLIKESDIN